MMCHNAVLVMQAMGLGGWFYNGLSRLSVLGTWAKEGILGLGFRIQRDERWTLPDPVGLDGHFETLGPPYQADMREAVQVFADRKFGPGGAYDTSIPGAFSDTPGVKRSVTHYTRFGTSRWNDGISDFSTPALPFFWTFGDFFFPFEVRWTYVPHNLFVRLYPDGTFHPKPKRPAPEGNEKP